MILSSFKHGDKQGVKWPLFSAAVYQPKGYSYPKAQWADIRDSSGSWIRPRNFVDLPNPLQSYSDALWRLYTSRLEAARRFFDDNGTDLILCCWCPYDKAAQRQLKEHGSFVCHTAVMYKFIKHQLNLKVVVDNDRAQRMVRL